MCHVYLYWNVYANFVLFIPFLGRRSSNQTTARFVGRKIAWNECFCKKRVERIDTESKA